MLRSYTAIRLNQIWVGWRGVFSRSLYLEVFASKLTEMYILTPGLTEK